MGSLRRLTHARAVQASNSIEGINASIEDVVAAGEHVNLTMIHPFSDGNGRMARCLQSLVLARDRIVEPVFASIEEYLGAHTQRYYDVLAEVGRGSWNPGRDARPWLRFCLVAHEQQAERLLQRLRDIERLWELCAEQVARRALPDRTIPALVDAARGFRLRNSSYRRLIESSEGQTIIDHTATRDLKAPELREIWATVQRLRRPRRIVDDDQARLPGL